MSIPSLTEDQWREGQILLIDKPITWSSFDVIRKLKGVINIRKLKIGHAGTLDPLATGLLIVCTGKKTKEIQYIQDEIKEYYVEIFLGGTTPTYDAEMPVENIKDATHVSTNDVLRALEHFTGNISQIPPVYSAIRVQGKRAYDLARSGKEVILQPRIVTIYSITLESFEPALHHQHNFAVLRIFVTCGKGTYIRSLAYDIGEFLHVGGFVHSLKRTKIGAYNIEDALSIE